MRTLIKALLAASIAASVAGEALAQNRSDQSGRSRDAVNCSDPAMKQDARCFGGGGDGGGGSGSGSGGV